MFTGLVQQMGTITAVEAGDTTRLTVTPDAGSPTSMARASPPVVCA